MKNKGAIIYFLFFVIFLHFPAHSQTPCVAGNAAGFPCQNVDLMAHLPLDSLGGASSANDVWGWTDTLTGKEYAIIGLGNGTAFVDISDPVNPVYLGTLPTATSNSSWRDIKVYGDFAFVVSEAGSHGVQSFDLRTLRNVASPPTTFSALDRLTAIGNAHNIVGLEEAGYMVVVGAGTCSGGLTFVNVQDPANMVLDGCFSSDGYTHDAVCFVYQGSDTEHVGKQICIASNTDTQTFVDVTNKSNPVSLARIPYASDYTHQGWITPDHKYLIFGDELDETRKSVPTRTFIMDISDLDNPSDPVYFEATTAAIDHNQYVRGRFAYQANYRAGFRMMDLKNISTITLNEAAYFDIYPDNDNGNFNGAWSVFPYFQSGLVVVSGIEQGLFILKPTVPQIVMDANRLPVLAGCSDQNIVFDINLTSFGGFSESVTLSVTGVPPEASAIFATNPIVPDASTTLTLHNANGFNGVHSLTIQARGPMNDTLQDLSVAFKISDNLYIDDSFLSMYGQSGVYHAANLVEIDAELAVDNHIDLNAGEEIHLHPNFVVPQGSSFHAWIENCGVAAKVPTTFVSEAQRVR
ncbi:MAG: choice-of-anchor B family protein [Saprospiraceae bacterium]|nr:choice-of-anchor B family protein [Saprospiraceae bacterium]